MAYMFKMEIKNEKIKRILDELSVFLFGKDVAVILTLIACFARGHLLIEDLPGMGKTTLALAMARVMDLSFSRIQCTSDLLPTDITGLSIYNRNSGEFEFHPGPIFNNIVLVDEINRATPKTQSALLEAMGEKQTTIDGKTYAHPQPFFIIATQNPAEHYGIFPLPESQMDRFLMKISLGYPHREQEKQILRQASSREDLAQVRNIMAAPEVLEIQDAIAHKVYVSEKVYDYILQITEATRQHPSLLTGISTRGALAVIAAAKARAYFCGRDFLIPEDIRELAEYTLPHRIMLKEEYESLDRKEVVQSILASVSSPA